MKEYKQKIVSRNSGNRTGCDSAPSGCQKLTKFYSDEIVKGFQDARRSSFDVKKLTKRELDFLMEYHCN